jgi:hypothetical protein
LQHAKENTVIFILLRIKKPRHLSEILDAVDIGFKEFLWPKLTPCEGGEDRRLKEFPRFLGGLLSHRFARSLKGCSR